LARSAGVDLEAELGTKFNLGNLNLENAVR
jgi:hypothetical protein